MVVILLLSSVRKVVSLLKKFSFLSHFFWMWDNVLENSTTYENHCCSIHFSSKLFLLFWIGQTVVLITEKCFSRKNANMFEPQVLYSIIVRCSVFCCTADPHIFLIFRQVIVSCAIRLLKPLLTSFNTIRRSIFIYHRWKQSKKIF